MNIDQEIHMGSHKIISFCSVEGHTCINSYFEGNPLEDNCFNYILIGTTLRLGVVLSQLDNDGQKKFMAYASRSNNT